MSIRSALRWLGTTVGAVAFGFVLDRLVRQVDELPTIVWSLPVAGSLVGAVVLSSLPSALAAVGLSLLLTARGVLLSQRDAFVLVGRSQIGKYLPGNVFHYLGRLALGIRDGLPAGPLSLAVGIETIFTVALALLIGGGGWLIEEGATDPRVREAGRLSMVLAGLGILTLICAIAVRLRRAVTRFLRRYSADYSLRTLLMVSGIYVLTFVAFGVALVALSEGVLGTTSGWNWLQFTWRFALIWVLGLATIGAPAGLGVREVLMLVWFSPALGETAALGLAALLRLTTISADIAVFVFASLLRPELAAHTR